MPFNDETIDRIGQMVNASPRGQANPPDSARMSDLTDPRASPLRRLEAMTALNAPNGGNASPMAMGAPQGGQPNQIASDLQTGVDAANQVTTSGSRSPMQAAGGGAVRQHYAQGGQVRGYADAGAVRLANKYNGSLMDSPAELGWMNAAPQPGAVQGYVGDGGAEKDTDPDGYFKDIRDELAARNLKKGDESKDKWMALLQGGLATMAAASQPGAKALGAIGQGGLVGLKGMQEAQALRAEEKMKILSLKGTLAEHQAAQAAQRAALRQRAEDNAATREDRKIQNDAFNALRAESNVTAAQAAEWRHLDEVARADARANRPLPTKMKTFFDTSGNPIVINQNDPEDLAQIKQEGLTAAPPTQVKIKDLENLKNIGSAADSIRSLKDALVADPTLAGIPAVGGIANKLAKMGISTEKTKKSSDWWSAVDAQDALVRNKLFGSAFTETERKAWNDFNIYAGMDKDLMKFNLERRSELSDWGNSKLYYSLKKNRMNMGAVESALGKPVLSEEEASKPYVYKPYVATKPDVESSGKKPSDVPAALKIISGSDPTPPTP